MFAFFGWHLPVSAQVREVLVGRFVQGFVSSVRGNGGKLMDGGVMYSCVVVHVVLGRTIVRAGVRATCLWPFTREGSCVWLR